MSKKKKIKKILIAIFSVVLIAAIGFGIFYLVSPREFLQFFMSDASYAATVISKNAVKAYTEIDAIEATGTITSEIKTSLITDESATKALNKYVSSLDVTSNFYVDESAVKGKLDLSDDDGSVITAEFVSANKKQYVKIDQLDLGWQVLAKGTSSSSSSKGDPVDITKAISISSSKKITLNGKTVEGEVISASFTVSKLKNGIVDDFIPETYREKFGTAIKSAAKTLSNYGIETISFDIYVNKKNEIVAVKVTLDGEKNNMEFTLVLGEEDSNISLNLGTESYGNFSFDLTAKPCEFKAFDVPTETTDFDKTKLKTAMVTYMTTTLVKEHPDFEDAYKAIFTSVVSENATDIVNNLLGSVDLPDNVSDVISNITSGSSFDITGIIENFSDVDTAEVSSMIENILSSFGISMEQ